MATVPYSLGPFGLTKDYPYISAPSVFQQLDSTPTNQVGTRFACVLNENSPGQEQTILRYVQYVSTANPAPLAYPACVTWVDDSFSKVTGVFSEGLGRNFTAGWLIPNTTSIAGLTAAQLANQYCWIAVGGYLEGASVLSTTSKGAAVWADTGNWQTNFVADGTAPTQKIAALAATAYSGGTANIIITSGYTV